MPVSNKQDTNRELVRTIKELREKEKIALLACGVLLGGATVVTGVYLSLKLLLGLRSQLKQRLAQPR